MKKALTFFIYFTLFFAVANGQKNYKPAYIITNYNDTIHGTINLKSNIGNSEKCEFKALYDTVLQKFKPFEIKGYRIENSKFYISKRVNINEEEHELFLEFLVDGIVDLYYLKKGDNDYYFLEKDTVLYQLSNDEIEINRDGIIYKVKTNQYKGVLKAILKDSKEVSENIDVLTFQYKNLVKLTEDYHNSICTDYSCINYSKITKPNNTFNIYVGSTISNMRFKSSDDITTNIKLCVGFDFRYRPAKLYQVWQMIFGINFSTNDFDGIYHNDLVVKNSVYRLIANYDIIKIPISFEYNFPTKKVIPFLSAGYCNSFIYNLNYEARRVVYNASEEKRTRFTRYQMGFIGTAGIKYLLKNKSDINFSLSFDYRKPAANFAEIMDYHYVNSYTFKLGYDFKI